MSVLSGLMLAPAVFSSEPVPIPRAHAHNDYRHPTPCKDALEQGFCSIEADIFLVEGALLVGHDRVDLRPEKTLESLYLAPLRERTEKFGGRIHPGTDSFYLWIDLKTKGNEMYPVLQETFKRYDDILSHFENGKEVSKAVKIILSGNKPIAATLNEKGRRYASIDGGFGELDSDVSADFIPTISMNWRNHFSKTGTGEMTDSEHEELLRHVRKAHEKGRKIRYWGAPDNESLWRVQYDAGVDFLNTDRLKEMREFLLRP